MSEDVLDGIPQAPPGKMKLKETIKDNINNILDISSFTSISDSDIISTNSNNDKISNSSKMENSGIIVEETDSKIEKSVPPIDKVSIPPIPIAESLSSKESSTDNAQNNSTVEMQNIGDNRNPNPDQTEETEESLKGHDTEIKIPHSTTPNNEVEKKDIITKPILKHGTNGNTPRSGKKTQLPSQRLFDPTTPHQKLNTPSSTRSSNRPSGPPSQRICELSEPKKPIPQTAPPKLSKTSRSPARNSSRINELCFLSPPKDSSIYITPKPKKTHKAATSRSQTPNISTGKGKRKTPKTVKRPIPKPKTQELEKENIEENNKDHDHELHTPKHIENMSNEHYLLETPKIGHANKKTLIMTQEDFNIMMTGTKKKKKLTLAQSYALKKPEKSSMLTEDEIKEIADSLIAGKKRRLTDPATIADVINELTNRRVDAMQKDDYESSKKLGEISNNLRLTFRQRDRENFHQEFVQQTQEKLNSAKQSLKDGEKEWNKRNEEFKQQCKDSISDLDREFQERIKQCEGYWQTPEAMRPFQKRSILLLQQKTMEKNMAMNGDYDAALAMQRVVRRTEAAEAAQKFEEMRKAFEWERKKIVLEHEHEYNRLSDNIGLNTELFNKKMNEALNVLKKRVKIFEDFLNEECKFENFCALKFKRAPDVILPTTVTGSGEDIPTAGTTRVTFRDSTKMSMYRSGTVFTPLSLPNLKIKALHAKDHTIVEKPKEEESF